MTIAVISNKGWVVIPKAYRQKYNLRSGDRVHIIDYGGGLSVVPLPQEPIKALRGMFAGGPSLTAALLAERQKARITEDSDLE